MEVKMDTHLIHQVVELEWRIQMENEKNGHHSEATPYFPIALEYCGKAIKSKLQYFIDLGRNLVLSIHYSSPA